MTEKPPAMHHTYPQRDPASQTRRGGRGERDSIRLPTDSRDSASEVWSTSAFVQLSQALLTASTLQEVLHACLEVIEPTVVNGVTVLLTGGPPSDSYLEIAAVWECNGHPYLPLGARFSTRDYAFQPLLTGQDAIVINALETDFRIQEPLRSLLLGANVQALVALPLRSGREQFGLIIIDRDDPRAFAPEHIHIYRAAAALAAGAVEKLRLIREANRALAETSTLYEISRRLSHSRNVSDILFSILDSQLFGAAGGSIALLEPSPMEGSGQDVQVESVGSQVQPNKQLVFWAAAGVGAERIVGMRMPLSQGIVGWVVRENQAAIVPDAYADERFYPQIDEATSFQTQSILCAPLRVEGRVIGAIELVDVPNSYLSQEGVRLLEQIADQAALFLENQRLLAQTQRQAQELSTLLNITQEMAATLDREQTLRLITSRILDLVKADGCHVFLLQPRPNDKPFLKPVASSDRDAAYILNTSLELGQGITGGVAQSGEGVLINRVDLDPRGFTVPGTEQIPESLISVPLVYEGRISGVMTVSRRGEQPFTSSDLNIVSAMASQAATVLENERLFDEAQQRTRELAALNAVVSTASQSLTLEEILDATLQRVADVLPDTAGLICLRDENSGELQIATHRNLPAALVRTLITKGMRGTLCEVTATQRQAYTVADLTASAPVDTSGLVKVGLYAYLGAPLIARGQVLGTLSVFGAQPNFFTSSDADLMTAIGQQVGIAVRNAQLYAQTERALKESRSLYDTSAAMSETLDLEGVLQIAVNRMAEYVGADQCRLVLFDERLGYGAVVAEYRSTPNVETIRIPMADNPSYQVLRDTGQAIAVEDVRTHPITAAIKEMLAEYGVKSMLLVPLIVQGHLIGSIDLDSTRTHRKFTQAELNFCRTLADRAALAIQNRQLLAQTQYALHETTRLYRASRALNQAQNLSDVLYAITDNLPIEQIDQCWMALTESEFADQDPTLRSFQIKALWDHEGDAGLQDVRFTAQELPMLAQPGLDRVWVINDLDSEARLDARSLSTLREMGIKSALMIPLLTGESLLGWLVLITHHHTHIFDPDQVHPYQVLADQAAVAIRNQQLLAQVQTSLQEVETVHRQYLRSEWSEFLRSREEYHTAFACDRGALLPLSEFDHPLIEQAINQGDPVAYVAQCDDDNGDAMPRASLVAPLKVRGQVLGVLGVEDPDQAHEWTPEEINTLQEIAERVAQAIESARLLDTTQTSLAEQARLAVQLEAASKISRAATSILELDVLLPSVVELIRDHFNYYHAQVFLIDSTQSWAVLRASTGEIGQRLLQRGYALEVGGSSIIGYVTHTGQPRIAQDVATDAVHLKDELLPDTRSEMAIPLRTGERIIGALDVQSTESDAFTLEDVQVLSTLADQLAVAIDNARLYQEQLEAAEKLREVDRLKSQFLANMSHELRTPLNSIIGFSRVILKGIDGPLTDLQKQDLTAIYNSGQNLLKLINDILDHAKIEAGKMEMAFEETDLNEVIAGAMTTAQALVKDKPQVELRYTLAPDLPTIIADATRVRQVLLNLLSNAAKFTQEGYIELTATHDERSVIIKVSDTGAGIPPDKYDVIFEAFEQVDGSPTRRVGGTGLGLPISRQFIEMHGGRIWVESEIGAGSTFFVQLPIRGPHTEPVVRDQPVVSTHQRLVLAIDDDDDVIQMYRRYLERQNYQVHGLTDSEQAVEIARELRPFAILLDLLMPNKDGWAIIRELKANPETQDMPIIMCSIVNAAGRGFSLGAADFLVKPITEKQLLTTLARLQDSSPEGRPNRPLQVLIIDDTADDRKLLRRTLESTDGAYHVLEASNGYQGIDMIQQQRPDLVVLDLMMPEMDGFAVLELLKRDEELRQIPIIIVTAKELTEQERIRINGQAAALFQKGLFKAEELLQDVNYALHQVGRVTQESTKEEE